jgi:DNA primase
MCDICLTKTLNFPLIAHLRSRHLNFNLHNVHLNGDEATFYLYNLSGQIVGYQKYNWKADKMQKNDQRGRYYTYKGDKLIPKHTTTVAVWGLESWLLSTVLFVTEGVFDAARLTQLGHSAVAVMSNDPSSSTLNWLKCVRQQRPVVAVCDPGRAGARLAKTGHIAHTINIPGMPDGDLGDADHSYVEMLINQYT